MQIELTTWLQKRTWKSKLFQTPTRIISKDKYNFVSFVHIMFIVVCVTSVNLQQLYIQFLLLKKSYKYQLNQISTVYIVLLNRVENVP